MAPLSPNSDYTGSPGSFAPAVLPPLPPSAAPGGEPVGALPLLLPDGGQAAAVAVIGPEQQHSQAAPRSTNPFV